MDRGIRGLGIEAGDLIGAGDDGGAPCGCMAEWASRAALPVEWTFGHRLAHRDGQDFQRSGVLGASTRPSKPPGCGSRPGRGRADARQSISASIVAAARPAPSASTGAVVDLGRASSSTMAAASVRPGLRRRPGAPGPERSSRRGTWKFCSKWLRERDVEERAPVGGELHAGGQAPLHDRDVAGGPGAGRAGARSYRSVTPLRRGRDWGSMRGPVTITNRRSSTARGRRWGRRSSTRAEEALAHAGAPDGDDADPLVGAVAELGAQGARGRRRAGSKP